ncbi:MAG: hypothetical protein ACOY2B_00840 [Pseudomonadota bacterium]
MPVRNLTDQKLAYARCCRILPGNQQPFPIARQARHLQQHPLLLDETRARRFAIHNNETNRARRHVNWENHQPGRRRKLVQMAFVTFSFIRIWRHGHEPSWIADKKPHANHREGNDPPDGDHHQLQQTPPIEATGFPGRNC